METTQVVDEFLAAFNAKDIEACKALLAQDFKFSGTGREPQNADEWMGNVMSMAVAFPDLNYNIQITGYEGNKVMGTTQLTGTHTGDWDLSAVGMGVIPASGKSFSNPKETGVMTIEDGKIVSYEIASSEKGGIESVFAQLGIQPPA